MPKSEIVTVIGRVKSEDVVHESPPPEPDSDDRPGFFATLGGLFSSLRPPIPTTPPPPRYIFRNRIQWVVPRNSVQTWKDLEATIATTSAHGTLRIVKRVINYWHQDFDGQVSVRLIHPKLIDEILPRLDFRYIFVHDPTSSSGRGGDGGGGLDLNRTPATGGYADWRSAPRISLSNYRYEEDGDDAIFFLTRSVRASPASLRSQSVFNDWI